jgi:trigger factor
VGKKIGDEFDVTVTFPEDYGVEDLSGKEAVFKCKLNGISVQELPEVDDEFIKDATEFDTVDEYKADTRKKLEEEAEKDAETNFSNAVMDAIIAKVDAPIPRVMFDRRVDDLLRNFDGSLRQQGLNLDLYMQYTGMTVDSLRDTYTERAENEVKLRLALEAIAKAENLDVTEDEVNEKLTEMAASYKMEVEKIKELIPMDEYKKDLIVDKAMELVKDSAVVDNDMPASADAE